MATKSQSAIQVVGPAVDTSWMKDEDYLDHLTEVSRLDLEGATARKIAEHFGQSYDKTRTDLRRLQQIRVASVDNSELYDMRQRSIDQFRLVQKEAWKRLKGVKPNEKTGPELLNQISAAEREIVRLQGTLTVLKESDQYDRSIHVNIINGIAERVSRIVKPGPTSGVSGDIIEGRSAGDPVLLAPVGTSESITTTWEVVDVDDPGGARLGETPGSGYGDTDLDGLEDDGDHSSW